MNKRRLDESGRWLEYGNPMLILSRKQGESVNIGHGLQVTVNALDEQRAQLVIERTPERQLHTLLRTALPAELYRLVEVCDGEERGGDG